MGEVHDLLLTQEKNAIAQKLGRGVVEAAAAYLTSEEVGIGFLYSGWCQSALPHKRLPDDKPWQFDGDRISLIVEPGWRRDPTSGTPTAVGVPYGSRARLILIYLQSEALRTGSPEIELGRSLRQWLGRMGISPGGNDIRIVRDQAERISRCRLTFEVRTGRRIGMVNQNIVEQALFIQGDDVRQAGLFTETVRLSDGFFRELQKHPVPLEDAAIRALSNNSQAIDIYCWLAYRLHALSGPTPVSWIAVKRQFGPNVVHMRGFRQSFKTNFQLALAVYPAAKIDITDSGVVLYPSHPPVAPKGVAHA